MEEIVIAMLDDVKAEMTREIEILSKKHIKSEDTRTRQIQMLELIRGVLRTISLVQEGDRVTKQQQEREPRMLELWKARSEETTELWEWSVLN